jgi:hypothetical protein
VKSPGSLVEEFRDHFGVGGGGGSGKYRVEMDNGRGRVGKDESVVGNGYVGGFDERDMIERLRMRGRDGSGKLEVGENVFGNRLYHEGGGLEEDTIKTEECFRTENFESFNGKFRKDLN